MIQAATAVAPTSYDDNSARAFLRCLADGLRPDPTLTVSDWADRHRMLSTRAAAEAGRYRTSRTPYMREIMVPCRRRAQSSGSC